MNIRGGREWLVETLGFLPNLLHPKVLEELEELNIRLLEVKAKIAAAPPGRPLHRRSEHREYIDPLTYVRSKELLRGEETNILDRRRKLRSTLATEPVTKWVAVWTGRSPVTVKAWTTRHAAPLLGIPGRNTSPPMECFYVLDGLRRGLLPIRPPLLNGAHLETLLAALGMTRADVARELWIRKATLYQTPIHRVPLWWGCALLLSQGHQVDPRFRVDAWRNN